MKNGQNGRVMLLLSVVERGKGKKLMARLKNKNIPLHFQCVGFGTAPTEMMDILGLGSNDKDIVFSVAAEEIVKRMAADFGDHFKSHSEFGGLMMILKLDAVNRLISEMVHRNMADEPAKEEAVMKNAHKHELVMITVGRGYADQVMQTAKQAGATGGTVIRGRLAESEALQEIIQQDIMEEREIILIMAPADVSRKIMDDVNREFGIRTEAGGIMCALPVEKAYKI